MPVKNESIQRHIFSASMVAMPGVVASQLERLLLLKKEFVDQKKEMGQQCLEKGTRVEELGLNVDLGDVVTWNRGLHEERARRGER